MSRQICRIGTHVRGRNRIETRNFLGLRRGRAGFGGVGGFWDWLPLADACLKTFSKYW